MPASRSYSALNDYSLSARTPRWPSRKGWPKPPGMPRRCPGSKMRELLTRRDWPAVRDTVLWFALILGSGWAGFGLWQAGSWWAAVPFMIYGVLYASTSDSRWHESGHGTAFKTDWLNNVLYEIASFMVMRESTVWRWSHTRHHSDTIIVGRDPEIAVPAPAEHPRAAPEFFRAAGHPQIFPTRAAPLRRPDHAGGEDLHPGIGVSEGHPPRPHLPADLRRRGRPGDLAAQPPAADVHRPADALRFLADADLRLHPARRPGGERPRPPAELPDGLYELHPPLPLLEHELPRRAPHVPARALSQPAEAARNRETRHARALPQASGKPGAKSSPPSGAR